MNQGVLTEKSGGEEKIKGTKNYDTEILETFRNFFHMEKFFIRETLKRQNQFIA